MYLIGGGLLVDGAHHGGYPWLGAPGEMSQFGQTLAALNSVLNNQVAESLSLWLREYSRSIRIAFPPPDPLLSDIINALDKDPSAAERLALRISWQPDQWQRECIRLKSRFEGSSPDEVRKKALSQGVILALCWEKEDESAHPNWSPVQVVI